MITSQEQIITSFRVTDEPGPRKVRWRIKWKADRQQLWWTVNAYFNERFPNGWTWFTSFPGHNDMLQITQENGERLNP